MTERRQFHRSNPEDSISAQLADDLNAWTLAVCLVEHPHLRVKVSDTPTDGRGSDVTGPIRGPERSPES